MRSLESLTQEIERIGFRCTGCGECCRSCSEDSDLVMVSPAEIARIATARSMRPEEIAEPYPESIDLGNRTTLTFEWALKRNDDQCTFLKGNRCTIYPDRPWICRTYPFMLDGDELRVYPCPGTGVGMERADAEEMARLLLARREAWEEEERRIQCVLQSVSIPAGERVLIDGEGMKVL